MLPVFSCVVVFCLWLRYELTKSSRYANKRKENFLELERKANFTRRQPIDNLDYIIFSEKTIPFIEINDNLIRNLQNSLLKFTDKKSLKLSEYTNTELKMMYGPANLPALSEYDENFTSLVRLLHKYALRLNELSFTSEAISVLEYAVSIGTDMGSSYKLLSDLYNSGGKKDKIAELISKSDNISHLYRDSTVSYMQSFLNH